METKLKDVFNLILGCDWVVTDEMYYDYIGVKSEGDIIKIDIISAPKLLTYGLQKEQSWIDYLLENAKPLLRPFCDMTEEEAIWIAEYILFDGYLNFEGRADKENDRWIVYDKGNYEGDNVEILFNGEIVWRVDGKVEDVRFECAYEVIPYLLKQGFDLFYLIETGQAESITKHKQNAKV